MQIRATTEHDTYVYATSPLRLGGLDPEDFLVMIVPVGILNTLLFPPYVSLFVGCFCLWLYKSLTGSQPSGFLPILISVSVGKALHTNLVKNSPPLQRLVTTLVRLINRVWIDAGLLPLPTYCNRYER